jgi:hypothetical protein
MGTLKRLETYRKSNGYGVDDNSAIIIAQFIRHIGTLGTIWQ